MFKILPVDNFLHEGFALSLYAHLPGHHVVGVQHVNGELNKHRTCHGESN